MKFYLTTTLPYVNAEPHIGFALEAVQADAWVRYQKLIGNEVFFNTGTDEHGLKIYRKAQEAGLDPQAYVDEYAAKFKGLKDTLGLSEDIHFIRTTDPHHKDAAQELWRRCKENGDIELRRYKGLYCVGDEAFMKDSDIVDGKCPNHPTMDLLEIEEENYFFCLSKYTDRLRDYLSREGVIVPEWRRQEALQFVERGLEDFSISRVKEKMPWGVPVPDDDSQVMYVWFDALTNYISTLGWPADQQGNFQAFWEEGETLQMAGKDQVRFQSIMWQGMLMSAGLSTTDRVVYHGFITSGGQKMSKSIGNVISPVDLVHEYGTEAVRYFLLRHVHPFEDSDVTHERIKEAYNGGLANGLGNLASRIMKMAQDNLDAPVAIDRNEKTLPEEFHEAFREFNMQKAAEIVWKHIQALDERIATEEPFKLVKSDPEKGKRVLVDLVHGLYTVARMLNPLMPKTSEAIKHTVLSNAKPENLFARKD